MKPVKGSFSLESDSKNQKTTQSKFVRRRNRRVLLFICGAIILSVIFPALVYLILLGFLLAELAIDRQQRKTALALTPEKNPTVQQKSPLPSPLMSVEEKITGEVIRCAQCSYEFILSEDLPFCPACGAEP